MIVTISTPWRESAYGYGSFGSIPVQWAAAVSIDDAPPELVTRGYTEPFGGPRSSVFLMAAGPVTDEALVAELDRGFALAFPRET